MQPLFAVTRVGEAGSGDLSVIDGATWKVVATWKVGSGPRGVVVSNDGRSSVLEERNDPGDVYSSFYPITCCPKSHRDDGRCSRRVRNVQDPTLERLDCAFSLSDGGYTCDRVSLSFREIRASPRHRRDFPGGAGVGDSRTVRLSPRRSLALAVRSRCAVGPLLERLCWNRPGLPETALVASTRPNSV